MSRDAEAKSEPKTARLYDKRTVERNIKKGLFSRKDYEKHLKSLEDIADKGVFGGPESDAREATPSASASPSAGMSDDDVLPLDGANNQH
jgi:hypothetical protein